MIRRIKHASTATCTLPIYMGFLMTEPNSISCTQLAETYNISHDSVNRFLEREDYTPHDLYQESIQHIDNNKLGGVSKSMLKQSRLNFDKIEKCE